ncbi:MAG: hypothetical protein NTW50_00015 [Candidatus Berkelbacteria bacterium]|nr:hypothetical protein [Candidatus Berkelbacteria bacterium]
MKFVYFFGLIILGFVTIKFNKWITDNTGRIDFAEKILSSGGTYTFWQIFGVAAIAGAFYIAFGGAF